MIINDSNDSNPDFIGIVSFNTDRSKRLYCYHIVIPILPVASAYNVSESNKEKNSSHKSFALIRIHKLNKLKASHTTEIKINAIYEYVGLIS